MKISKKLLVSVLVSTLTIFGHSLFVGNTQAAGVLTVQSFNRYNPIDPTNGPVGVNQSGNTFRFWATAQNNLTSGNCFIDDGLNGMVAMNTSVWGNSLSAFWVQTSPYNRVDYFNVSVNCTAYDASGGSYTGGTTAVVSVYNRKQSSFIGTPLNIVDGKTWSDQISTQGEVIHYVYVKTGVDQGSPFADDCSNSYFPWSLYLNVGGGYPGNPINITGANMTKLSEYYGIYYQGYPRCEFDYWQTYALFYNQNQTSLVTLRLQTDGQVYPGYPDVEVIGNQNGQDYSGIGWYLYYGPPGGPPPPPPPPSSWTFIGQVMDEATASLSSGGLPQGALSLWGSYDGQNPIRTTSLGTCVSQQVGGPFSEQGYCKLETNQFYPYYFIEKVTNPPGYSSTRSECTFAYSPRPPTGLNICNSVTSDIIRRGPFSQISQGTYAGNVFKTVFSPTPWWQVKDSDIIASSVSSSNPTGEYFDLDGDGGYPGVVIYGNTATFGGGGLSSKSWLAKTRYSGRIFDYNYLSKLAPTQMFTDASRIPAGATISGGTLISGYQSGGYIWRYGEGDLTFHGTANVGNRKMIVFVNGDLDIGTLTNSAKITVNDGRGFIAFIVRGNINISRQVRDDNVDTVPGVGDRGRPPALEGIYLSDGVITVDTFDTTPDYQLRVRGILAGLNSVILKRDLGPGNQEPGEYLEFAPDQILTFPRELARKLTIWKEVSP